jgi:hypothetical protein
MTLIKNYNNINKNIIFTKKIVSKTFFNKNYIIKKEKNIFLINSDSAVLKIFSNSNEKYFNEGFSTYNKNFIFRHSLNSFLNVKSLLNFVAPNYNLVLKNILKNFSILLKKKNKMLLLNPVLGGYIAFYIGFYGFISRVDIKKILSYFYEDSIFINKNINKLVSDLTINRNTYFIYTYLKLIFLKLSFFKNVHKMLLLPKIELKIKKLALVSIKDYKQAQRKEKENFIAPRDFKLIFVYSK